MPRYAVLLRGVNVGKGNRVPMAEFKALLEKLGYSDVQTLLNSGNAVFTGPAGSSAKHAEAVANALQARLAITTPVIVKSGKEFSAVIDANPIPPPEADHSRFLVAFARDSSSLKALEPLVAMAQAPERFVVTKQAAFLHCPGGLLESRVATALLGKPGRSVTTRNWATVLKLGALLDSGTGKR